MAETESSGDMKQQSEETTDPVLSMVGAGKRLWKDEPGDRFVERLRSEDLIASARSTIGEA